MKLRMLQKYKLPVIVKPSKPALLHLFIIGFFFTGFQACRISDIQSYATDDAYFSLSDIPETGYVPLITSNSSMSDDSSQLEGSVIVRDASGNLIVSSGVPDFNYDNYYDYSYSSRIRRFGSGTSFSDYFSPWYTEHYWFSKEVPYWGTNIYETTAWNWYGYGSAFFPFGQTFCYNPVMYNWNWPYSLPNSNSWGNSGYFGNPVSNTQAIVYRKRSILPSSQSSFSGFSYAGRPATTAGNTNMGEGSSTRSPKTIPAIKRQPSERSPSTPDLKPPSDTKTSVKAEPTPPNSATRFDNRKENGLIREDEPSKNPRSVPPTSNSNTGRKVSFGEGSRTVPSSSVPSNVGSTPTSDPGPTRSAPSPRPSSSTPQKQSAPVRSTPSGQRPR